jgi:hypothetical protein
MGRKGMVDCEKECPEQRMAPEMVGKTSMASSSSFTLLWMVWFSLMFLRRVF